MIPVYIHGASATPSSFNYIRKKLNHHNDITLAYDSRNGFKENLERMKDELKDVHNIFFICHSLGGIYALHLSEALPKQVLGAVTMSTPYNGAEAAEYMKHILPFNRLFKDIGPSSCPIRKTNKIKIQHPWTNIVSTRGASPLILSPNDGVVTIKSMMHREDINYIEVPVNHYEVVLDDRVVDIIKSEIKKVTK